MSDTNATYRLETLIPHHGWNWTPGTWSGDDLTAGQAALAAAQQALNGVAQTRPHNAGVRLVRRLADDAGWVEV